MTDPNMNYELFFSMAGVLAGRAMPSADLSFWSSRFPCLFNRPRSCEAQSSSNLG